MKNKKVKKNVGRFAGLPIPLLMAKEYTKLSPLSKALLLELAAQYDGRNNGYLSLTRKDLKARGFNSPTSNQTSIEALIEKGFITKTIQGGIGSGVKHCSLYGINWQPSDERLYRPFQYPLEKGITKYREEVLDAEKVSVLIPRQKNQRADLRLINAS
ncbi:hypothetical protein AB4304_03590 [Vibrio breoganii]|uniref:hypothetical protein n=1 Tax=Vibrio breoganii TaxID=553239 RepID=UPI000C8472AA|nr:hypothetical protein [Vibrio breoganii]PMG07207.1 hypothetical protein BCV00_08475 [Vibrio breoganii]PMK31888.1 hypothetical protein BCU03_06030 [Vibrio breoganii]PMK47723.1 hypothetical protein BCU00_05130 [Vibrio breoganii]TKG23306.1 hypothetical protein FCV84_00170 [Vibrio breoganii]